MEYTVLSAVVTVLCLILFWNAKTLIRWYHVLKQPINVDNRSEMEMFREHMKKQKQNAAKLKSELEYEPWNTDSVKRFQPVMQNTHCLFARSAKIWGSRWDDSKSLEDNVIRDIETFKIFLEVGKAGELDGFLFEARGKHFHSNVHVFGQTVRRILSCLSAHDPAGVNCMKKSYVGKRGWYFEFNNEPIFITTFAPFYPSSSSRYAFGIDEESSFVLLQPEYSFTWRDIGEDTPHTEWNNPKTMRDKIRCEFKKHGRMYEIPPTVVYPTAHKIVKPLEEGMPVIEWWNEA